MPKKPGAYYRPEDLGEALRFLAQPDTVPLGGGTKLLASEAGLDRAAVVDLQALSLNQVQHQDNRLAIGASLTLTGFAEFLQKEEKSSPETALLAKAIRQAGPNTYRHAATFGGTVASRLADSELLAALLVLQAQITLYKPEIESMSLSNYLQVDDSPSGLISEISLDWTGGQGASERVARTPADYPIVSITCWKPAQGTPRLAATGLGARPFRLSAAEALLKDGLDEQSVLAAAEAAGAANSHPGDFRGNAAYRTDMAVVLTRRVLEQLLSG